MLDWVVLIPIFRSRSTRSDCAPTGCSVIRSPIASSRRFFSFVIGMGLFSLVIQILCHTQPIRNRSAS